MNNQIAPVAQVQVPGWTLTPDGADTNWGDFLVAAPSQATVQMTPTAPLGYFQFDFQVTNVLLTILDANTGTNLTAQTNTVIVGQAMNLVCQLNVTNYTATNWQWTVPGFAISNYVVAADSSSAMVATNFATNNATVNFYWVDGATNRTVQVSAMINGHIVTAQATFNVVRPTATITAQTASVNVYGDKLEFLDTTMSDGITFSNAITIPTGFSGSNLWIQICYYRVRQLLDTNLIWHRETENGSSPYGDTPIPYSHFIGTNPVDSPKQPLPSSGYVRCDAANTFTMWMMFQPTGGIPVPLRAVNWSWSGSATNVPFGDAMVIWSLEHGTNSVNPIDFDAQTFPIWNSDILNRQWIPPGTGLY